LANDKVFAVEYPSHPEFNTSVFAPDEETAIKYVKQEPLFRQRFPKRAPEMTARFLKRAGV
jgi:hypothetical protein